MLAGKGGIEARGIAQLKTCEQQGRIAIDRAAHPGDILPQGLEGRALLRDVAAQPFQLFETGGQHRLVA